MGNRHGTSEPLGVTGVLWWIAFAVLGAIPVLAWFSLDLPWWTGPPLLFLLALAARPMQKRYEERLEAVRPGEPR